ncbi:MAG: restriction endonuclease [Planctomycetes bacterium]|nr:restriction endonuclease [Planctomycetota bacterium]
MPTPPPDPKRFVEAISQIGLSIYSTIQIGDPKLWIPAPELQILLNDGLKGVSLAGLPLRTRSKIIKENVCKALGYPVPKSFQKTQPRFPGQNFDTYGQKSNNLQVWNEELSPTRRYVLIRISENDVIDKVKVVTGDVLALLDTTGTLTQKYQARCDVGTTAAELVSNTDTELLQPYVSSTVDLAAVATPISYPKAHELLPIATVFERLKELVGKRFPNPGSVQERNRGEHLHKLVCKALGYKSYQDDGQFPDVKHQLLECKLQTSPTIDLGLVTPSSTEPLDVPHVGGKIVRHCDTRYSIAYGRVEGADVVLTHVIVTTGEAFFTRFPQFQGKVLNRKLQIPLPGDFFDT